MITLLRKATHLLSGSLAGKQQKSVVHTQLSGRGGKHADWMVKLKSAVLFSIDEIVGWSGRLLNEFLEVSSNKAEPWSNKGLSSVNERFIQKNKSVGWTNCTESRSHSFHSAAPDCSGWTWFVRSTQITLREKPTLKMTQMTVSEQLITHHYKALWKKHLLSKPFYQFWWFSAPKRTVLNITVPHLKHPVNRHSPESDRFFRLFCRDAASALFSFLFTEESLEMASIYAVTSDGSTARS